MKKKVVMLKRNGLKEKYRLWNGPLYLDDLTDDQRIELKQSMLFHDDETNDLPVFWGELDTLVSDNGCMVRPSSHLMISFAPVETERGF